MNGKMLFLTGDFDSNSGKVVSDWLEVRDFIPIDLKNLENTLLLPGAEGSRQILNYFGKDYLLKSGKVNLKKLSKFVTASHQKFRIYLFMMLPILANEIVKVCDRNKGKNFLIKTIHYDQKIFSRFGGKIVEIVGKESARLLEQAYGKKAVPDLSVEVDWGHSKIISELEEFFENGLS